MKLAGSAIILAGGQSRRMGQDKAEMAWSGTTLLGHGMDAMRKLFMEVMMIHGLRDRSVPPGVTGLRDEEPGSGPMAGLLTGLRRVSYPWAFVTACDMPFLSPDLIRFFWSLRSKDLQAVIPIVQGIPQPVFGCYSRKALVNGQVLWDQGERSPQKWLSTLSVRWVQEWEMRSIDPELHSLVNVNTPEEFARAKETVSCGPV